MHHSPPPVLQVVPPSKPTPPPDGSSPFTVIYEERCPAQGQRCFRIISGGVTMIRLEVADEWCDEEFQGHLKVLSMRYSRRALLSLVR